MTDMKLRTRYTLNPNEFGQRKHSYEVVGRDGGLQLHITENLRHVDDGLHRDAWGGLECHYRTCPPWDNKPPDHAPCWLLGGPCWHDGTSLYVEETIMPIWRLFKHEPEKMLTLMEGEYKKFIVERLKPEPVEA